MRAPTPWFFAVTLAVAGLALLADSPARACSPFFPMSFVADPDGHPGDDTPPGPITDVTVEVDREQAPAPSDCDGAVDSCGAFSQIYVRFTPPMDAAPADALGYRVEAVGDVPEGLIPFQTNADGRQDILAPGGEIQLSWHDDYADEQADVRFTLRISAIDPAGNVGAPVEVEVVAPAEGDAGCAMSRAAPVDLYAALALIGLGLLPARRRRRG